MIICSHGSTKTFGEDWSGNLDSGRTEIVKKRNRSKTKVGILRKVHNRQLISLVIRTILPVI